MRIRHEQDDEQQPRGVSALGRLAALETLPDGSQVIEVFSSGGGRYQRKSVGPVGPVIPEAVFAKIGSPSVDLGFNTFFHGTLKVGAGGVTAALESRLA